MNIFKIIKPSNSDSSDDEKIKKKDEKIKKKDLKIEEKYEEEEEPKKPISRFK